MARLNGQMERYCKECDLWFEVPKGYDLVECPKCKQKQRYAKCNRCDKEWKLHRAGYPMHCPNCKSAYYNITRMQDRENVAKKYTED